MLTVITPDPREAVFKVAALKILADYIRDDLPQETILRLVPLFISGKKRLEMPVYALP